MLREVADWMAAFWRMRMQGSITDGAKDIVSAGVQSDRVEAILKEIRDVTAAFLGDFGVLSKKLSLDFEVLFEASIEKATLPNIGARLDLWTLELPRLPRWAQFNSLADTCMNTVAAPVAHLILEDRLQQGDGVPCFEGSFCDALLHFAFMTRTELANFAATLHEKKIEDFASLDAQLIEANRRRLASKLWQDKPKISSYVSGGSEAGILLGELRRRRGHMPIRKLMLNCGGLIQKMKPCFMMSPLSIAQFLDARTVRFDLVLFDEASQVRPEDALGAFLRGKQAAVMGDTRQLPPTTFFDRMVEEEQDGDDITTSISDLESILDFCAVKWHPTRRLLWHYRSRHESLIAVSNQEFYDNQLLVYPCATSRSDYLGLHFRCLPDTIYDRGRSRVNRHEARAVAEAAVEHFRLYPDKSLGIGAFSINQQEAIEQEIELQKRLNPDFEDFFSRSRENHFFVKNLETIQGDERDVIFLSIGYGFDGDRHMTRNFGPLNKAGGERRLNVLVTRARERCVIFSNFRAKDLSAGPDAAFGVRALKVLLEYAETGKLLSSEHYGESESPFEDSVCGFLRSHNHEVRKQVGCAQFRVDLGVVDPEAPGRYLLGVECDGAQYHSSRVARDRDRLRDQILRERGWRIHHVWSTDWYRNRPESEKALLKAIDLARQEDPVLCSGVGCCGEDTEIADDPVDYGEETEIEDSQEPTEDGVVDYELCASLGISTWGQLHEQPSSVLAVAVENVVSIEWPVCLDEVVRRIRSLWGLRRSGWRIQEAISRGVDRAVREGKILREGAFLWSPTGGRVRVRYRVDDPPPRIDLICDEEIAEAVKIVLKGQFATFPDNLATEASRLFGIQATSSDTGERIKNVVHKLVRNGVLKELPSGMVDLASD